MVKEKDTIFHWIPTLQILSVVFHLAGSTNDYTCTPAMLDMQHPGALINIIWPCHLECVHFGALLAE